MSVSRSNCGPDSGQHHVTAVPQLDQFSGSLIEHCLGDAPVFAVKGSPSDIRASYLEWLGSLSVDHTTTSLRNHAFG